LAARRTAKNALNADKQYMYADKFNQNPRLLYAMLSIFIPQFGATVETLACEIPSEGCAKYEC
jgi:hypothetical protein